MKEFLFKTGNIFQATDALAGRETELRPHIMCIELNIFRSSTVRVNPVAAMSAAVVAFLEGMLAFPAREFTKQSILSHKSICTLVIIVQLVGQYFSIICR